MLKAVAVSDDGRSLVLSRRANAKNASFRLPIDAALVARLEEARERVTASQTRPKQEDRRDQARPAPPVAPVSKLTPKEVQALLRQGRSAAAVAKKAGVDVAWVERFETPIIWERSGMAQRAQRATLVRPRSGPSALPLGEAVRVNLDRRHVALDDDQLDAAWDAMRRGRGNTWTVTFSFFSRGRNRRAAWEYDPLTDELRALDKAAAELGWTAKGRRRRA